MDAPPPPPPPIRPLLELPTVRTTSIVVGRPILANKKRVSCQLVYKKSKGGHKLEAGCAASLFGDRRRGPFAKLAP